MNNIENLALESLNESKGKATYGKYIIGRCSKEENALFVKGLEIFGTSWRKIRKLIPTRTCDQIRSHSQKYFKALIKKRRDKSKEQQEATTLDAKTTKIQDRTNINLKEISVNSIIDNSSNTKSLSDNSMASVECSSIKEDFEIPQAQIKHCSKGMGESQINLWEMINQEITINYNNIFDTNLDLQEISLFKPTFLIFN